MNDRELLAFHQEIVATPSVSRDEGRLTTRIQAFLRDRGVSVVRYGDNLYALTGDAGPLLAFNSHMDTVPPAEGWTRKPWEPCVVEGRVYGLGSNDAKASVAAMTAAFLRLHAGGGAQGFRVLLTLVVQEETGGAGAEILVPELARRGLAPDVAVIGEPTGLDVAVAQKGLLMLELRSVGQACHAAHGRALGARNAVRELARDLVALESVSLGPDDPVLGPVTLEPTLLTGGTARNVVPAAASCALDVRINPGPDGEVLLGRLRDAVQGEIAVRSDRLKPCRTDAAHPLARAALAARPGAVAFGSRGLSDWVYFRDCPAVKVGPGRTERSHTPDEFVLESEILEGAAFFERLALGWGRTAVDAARGAMP